MIECWDGSGRGKLREKWTILFVSKWWSFLSSHSDRQLPELLRQTAKRRVTRECIDDQLLQWWEKLRVDDVLSAMIRRTPESTRQHCDEFWNLDENASKINCQASQRQHLSLTVFPRLMTVNPSWNSKAGLIAFAWIFLIWKKWVTSLVKQHLFFPMESIEFAGRRKLATLNWTWWWKFTSRGIVRWWLWFTLVILTIHDRCLCNSHSYRIGFTYTNEGN